MGTCCSQEDDIPNVRDSRRQEMVDQKNKMTRGADNNYNDNDDYDISSDRLGPQSAIKSGFGPRSGPPHKSGMDDDDGGAEYGADMDSYAANHGEEQGVYGIEHAEEDADEDLDNMETGDDRSSQAEGGAPGSSSGSESSSGSGSSDDGNRKSNARKSAAQMFGNWTANVDNSHQKGSPAYVHLTHDAGQHHQDKITTSALKAKGEPGYNKTERPDDHPNAPFIGGNHSHIENGKLFDAKTDFFSANYQPVPGLYSYMFDNTARDPKYEMLQLAPDPAVHDWINLHPEHTDYPKALFFDTLGNDYQPRTCGRYTVLSKIWNGRPAYFSKMARMYLYNNSDDPHSPEWAISRKLGANSIVILIKGDIHTEKDLKKARIFCYDKYSDDNHVRGRLTMVGVLPKPEAKLAKNVGRNGELGSRKVRLSEGGGAQLFTRTLELSRHTVINFNAFVECKDIQIIPCLNEKEVKDMAAKLDKSSGRQSSLELVKTQNNILQKEWYIAKHTPLLVYKTSGAPTFTVGCYVPVIQEYSKLLPAKAQAVLDREAAHYRRKNPEENYLRFPKYYCQENDLFMFFNPVKCQWKVISSAEMHTTHSVKACSEMPTRVIFPPLVNWQTYFDVKIQVPSPESSDIDHHLSGQGIELYIDRDFPPDARSIADRTRKGVQGEVRWYRAREIHDSDYPVNLFDNISSSDIVQGGLGDCWLLAALAVIAEYPSFIPTYTFHQNCCNLEGRYHFNLFDYSKGTWVVVEIDDFIPCYPKSAYAEQPIPRFSQPHGNEIWLLLLEKAFAKMVGGYMNLKAGYAGLAWMMCTGCMDYNRWILEKGSKPRTWRRRPIMMYHSTGQHLGFEYADYSDSDPLYEKEVFLNYLRKAEKRNYLMSAVGVYGGATETIHDNGLIEGHAYGVLQILDIPCSDGKTRVLVKLRNPWGDHHEWKGTFSDHDEASWKLVKHQGRGIRVEECNGTFWMEATDFLDYFTHIECLHFDMINYTGSKVYNKGLRESQIARRADRK